MKREYTATCYIFKDEKVLFVYHKKFQKWMPPGGHVDPNETPQEAAVREVLEETGLTVQLISDESHLHYPNVTSLTRPYMCLLEEIPAYKNIEAHQHIDFIFLAEVIGGTEKVNSDESDALRWFSYEELLTLSPGVDLFSEVFDIALPYLQPQHI